MEFYGERYVDELNQPLAARIKSGEIASYDFRTAVQFYKLLRQRR